MSRNAIGNRDNGKVHRDSVVVLYETSRHRGSLRTNLQVPRPQTSPWNFRGICILQTQYYDYDAPESRWRKQGFFLL